MKILELENHVRQVLPLNIGGFVDKFQAVSAVVASDVMTINKLSHGFTTGDSVRISGIEFDLNISLVSLDSDGYNVFATLQSVEDNNITPGFPKSVTISGADAPPTGSISWNGSFEVSRAIDRKNFIVKVPGNIDPSLSGTPIIKEENLARYNSTFVITVIDDDNFSVAVVNSPDVTLSGTILFFNINEVRVAGDTDLEFFLQAYTQADNAQESFWCALTAGASFVSKDRDSKNDFPSDIVIGSAVNQQIQDNISVYVILPVVEDLTPIQKADIARNELKAALIKTICGFVPSATFNDNYGPIYFVTESIESIDKENRAAYLHRYDFAANTKISEVDTFEPQSVAINKIVSNYANNVLGSIIAIDTINFDN